MAYVFANFDKGQYFRPQAFGAPQLVRHEGAAERHVRAPHFGWTMLLVGLFEDSPSSRLCGKPWPFTWTGDRVALLRGDDLSGALVPEDVRALRAIAAQEPLTSYQYVREHFKDVTAGLKKRWERLSATVAADVPIRSRKRQTAAVIEEV
jgi:hypothetical protein